MVVYEAYLDPRVRAGISMQAKTDLSLLAPSLARLEADLVPDDGTTTMRICWNAMTSTSVTAHGDRRALRLGMGASRARVRQPVGVGSGLDVFAAERKSVDDCGAQVSTATEN